MKSRIRDTKRYGLSKGFLGVAILEFVAMFGYSSTAHAVRAEYGVGAGAEYSDNVSLVESDERDDLALSVFTGFLLEHNSADLDADVRGGIEYTSYTQNVFSDETLGTLRADVEWRPYPGVMHWNVEDYFTQTLRNPVEPETPENRINANAFSTGPDFFVRLDPATRIEAQLRRAEFYFEDSLGDSSRNVLSVGWVRGLRPELDVSANLAYEDADFKDSDLDFQRMDYFLRSMSRRGRSNMVVDLGATRIEREGAENVDGFLGRVVVARQIGVTTLLNLEVSSQYTDSGMDMLAAGAGPFALDLSNEQISGDLFNDRRVEARYRSGTVDQNWGARLQVRDEDYETLPLDRGTRTLQLDFHRGISPSFYLNGHVLLRREKYTNAPAHTETDSQYGLGLERAVSRKITARLDYVFNTRDSSRAGFDYDENRILFLVYYGSSPAAFR